MSAPPAARMLAASQPTRGQFASAADPIIQKSAPRMVLGSALASATMIAALANAPTITPAIRRVRRSALAPRAPTRLTASATSTAATEPANAASVTTKSPVNPSANTITAPTAAPPDTPRRYGSASGVLRDPRSRAAGSEPGADQRGEHHPRQPQIAHDGDDGGITMPTQPFEHRREWNRNGSTRDRERGDSEQRRNEEQPIPSPEARQRSVPGWRRFASETAASPSLTDGRATSSVSTTRILLSRAARMIRHRESDCIWDFPIGPARMKSGFLRGAS